MHRTCTEDGTTYFHNGDFSGDVRVYIEPDSTVQGHVPSLDGVDGPEVNRLTEACIDIPFEHMKTIVAEWLRSIAISALEDMDDNKIISRLNIELEVDPL